MNSQEVKHYEKYVTKDIQASLDDKENEEKLFNEYYNHHQKEKTMNILNEIKQKSQNDISKEIDCEIKIDENLQ